MSVSPHLPQWLAKAQKGDARAFDAIIHELSALITYRIQRGGYWAPSLEWHDLLVWAHLGVWQGILAYSAPANVTNEPGYVAAFLLMIAERRIQEAVSRANALHQGPLNEAIPLSQCFQHSSTSDDANDHLDNDHCPIMEDPRADVLAPLLAASDWLDRLGALRPHLTPYEGRVLQIVLELGTVSYTQIRDVLEVRGEVRPVKSIDNCMCRIYLKASRLKRARNGSWKYDARMNAGAHTRADGYDAGESIPHVKGRVGRVQRTV